MTDTKKLVWAEDDAMPSDREGLREAYQRITGIAFDPIDAIRANQYADLSVYYVMPNGYEVFASYPGNSTIYRREEATPK